jgi:5'-deoxynucleotidase YfbR-like HD superfamily hydrolase
MPEEISIFDKHIKEDNAMKVIISSFPSKIAILYSELWKEYTLDQTKEVHLVKQLDKMEMYLQANQYFRNGYSFEFLSQFLKIIGNIEGSDFQPTLANILKHLDKNS